MGYFKLKPKRASELHPCLRTNVFEEKKRQGKGQGSRAASRGLPSSKHLFWLESHCFLLLLGNAKFVDFLKALLGTHIQEDRLANLADFDVVRFFAPASPFSKHSRNPGLLRWSCRKDKPTGGHDPVLQSGTIKPVKYMDDRVSILFLKKRGFERFDFLILQKMASEE